MNVEFFIAKRISSSGGNNQKLSEKIVRFALVGIALGLTVMILSVAIVTGFKKEVRNKVIGFNSQIQIINLDSNQSFETQPLSKNQSFLNDLVQTQGIKHIQTFATKPGIIKTENEVQGIVLKGIDKDFDWSFFEKNKLEGHAINLTDTTKSNEIWISKQIASLLNLQLGDNMLMFFINDSEHLPRSRVFKIAGIYKTGLEEFDRMFALVDIRHIQRLNNWKNDEISGFEVYLDNPDQTGEYEKLITNLVLAHVKEETPMLKVVNFEKKYPQISDWLKLLDMNVWIILALMVLVAGFNMVSGLLVIILERTQMIGILKSIGSPDWSIRKVFLYFSALLISRALLWGNILAIGICIIQGHFHLIKLDPESYYMNYVPINFSFIHLILINLGTIAITILMLLFPSVVIGRISPEKTIRFD